MLGPFLSGLFSHVVVCLSIPLYQFPGTIFRCREGDFNPFSVACSRLASCSFSSHLVRFRLLLCVSSPLSRRFLLLCVAFELVKTAHVIIHPLPAPSHPSHLVISSINRPALLPVHRHDRRGVFFLLAVLRSVSMRLSFLPVGLLCLFAFPSRRYCPRVGLLCPSSSVVYRACPVLVVMLVGGDGIGSLLLAPLVRYGERGAWVAVGACGGGWRSHVRMACYHPAPFSLGVWGCAACSLICLFLPARSRPMPYSLTWSVA